MKRLCALLGAGVLALTGCELREITLARGVVPANQTPGRLAWPGSSQAVAHSNHPLPA